MNYLNFLAALLFVMAFAAPNSSVAQNVAIGQGRLQKIAGKQRTNGTGVRFLHVESERTDKSIGRGVSFSPDQKAPQFKGKTFVSPFALNQGKNAHATSLGIAMYANGVGIADGLGKRGSPPIAIAGANNWIFNQLGTNHPGDRTPNQMPRPQPFDVSTHSYIVHTSNAFTKALAENALQRLDYVIANSKMTTVVGANNKANSKVPALLIQAYNVIGVGRSDGEHSSGKTTLNGKGRLTVDIVAPRPVTTGVHSTSGATSVVSACAAVLHQTGAKTDAVKPTTMKAILLAGATKEEFPSWSHSESQPLDTVYGAGEINLLNSYQIQKNGRWPGTLNAGKSKIRHTPAGWDRNGNLPPGDSRVYTFQSRPKTRPLTLSVVLTWNLAVTNGSEAPGEFLPKTSLADLKLELYRMQPDAPDLLIERSDSEVDNLEHLYIRNLAAGQYYLKVENKNTENSSAAYAIAVGESLARTRR